MSRITKNEYLRLKGQIMQWVEEDGVRMAEFCSALVKCKSMDPPGDTCEVMRLVENFMADERLPYEIMAVNETMPNLISSINFAENGRHIMFNGHLDTLPAGDEPGWTDDPWSGRISDGQIWGRGSADMKGGVTAMLFAYSYLARLKEHLSGKVSLTLVSDEETGEGRGTGYLFESIPDRMLANCVLSAEPSGIGAVSFASKGYLQYAVSVATPGAIGGYCHDSRSAIRIAADIMRDLDELGNMEISLPEEMTAMLGDTEWVRRHELLRGTGHAGLIGKITTDISTVSGGILPGLIAPDCTFSATTVIPVGMEAEMVVRNLTEIVSRYPEASLDILGVDKADWCLPSTIYSRTLRAVAQELSGLSPEMTPDIAISDLRYWRYRGIPAYWYGPDSTKCGAGDESVSIDEILHVAATYALTVIRLMEDMDY